MGKGAAAYFDKLSDKLIDYISTQIALFFIATAPLKGDHVNVSPKGYPRNHLSILSSTQLAYIDLTGSGSETIAHLKENGRITFMTCSFTPDLAQILRIWGKGRVIERSDPSFDEWLDKAFISRDIDWTMGATVDTAVRSIIVIDIKQVGASCGYCVPIMEFVEDRPKYGVWTIGKKLEANGTDWATRYQQTKNLKSLDGLPSVIPIKKKDRGGSRWYITDETIAWAKGKLIAAKDRGNVIKGISLVSLLVLAYEMGRRNK